VIPRRGKKGMERIWKWEGIVRVVGLSEEGCGRKSNSLESVDL